MYNIYAIIYIYISLKNQCCKKLGPKIMPHLCRELISQIFVNGPSQGASACYHGASATCGKMVAGVVEETPVETQVRLWVCGLMTSIFLGLMTQTPVTLTT